MTSPTISPEPTKEGKEYGDLLSFNYADSEIPLKDQVLAFAKRLKDDEQLNRLLSTEQRENLKQLVKKCYIFLNQSIDSSKHSRETILHKCEELERDVNSILSTVIMVKEKEAPQRAIIDSLKLKKISSDRQKKRRSGRSFFSTLLFPKNNSDMIIDTNEVEDTPIYLKNQIEATELENLSVEGKLRKFISGLETNLFKKQGYVDMRFDFSDKYYIKKYIIVDFDKLVVYSKKDGKEEKQFPLNNFTFERIGNIPIDFGNKHFELGHVFSLLLEEHELFLSFSDDESLGEWAEIFGLIFNRNFSLINYNFKLTNSDEIQQSIFDEYSLLVDQKDVMIILKKKCQL
eukprot:gene4380-7755_t